MSANDIQIGGEHYKSAIQHWDFAAANFGPGYFRGNATKYVTRSRKKNGLEDVKKARHYVQKMLEVDWEALGWSLAGACGRACSTTVKTFDFAAANGLDAWETLVVEKISRAAGTLALEEVLQIIDVKLSELEPPERSPRYSEHG